MKKAKPIDIILVTIILGVCYVATLIEFNIIC